MFTLDSLRVFSTTVGSFIPNLANGVEEWETEIILITRWMDQLLYATWKIRSIKNGRGHQDLGYPSGKQQHIIYLQHHKLVLCMIENSTRIYPEKMHHYEYMED